MRICIAAVALSLLSLSVYAQTGEPKPKGLLKGACSADVQKFCADTPKGNGRVRACLDAHQADVSDTCKAAMTGQPKK